MQKELVRMSLTVSKSTMNRIANNIRNQRQLCLLNRKKTKFRHRRRCHHRHRATAFIVSSFYTIY